MQVPDLQPGTWADWANAISTTLAFTVALVLFVIGLRDRRRANDDHLRDQARRIWIYTGTPTREWDDDKSRFYATVSWEIRNSSEEAITNCRIGLSYMPRTEIASSKPKAVLVLPDTAPGGRIFGHDQHEQDCIMAANEAPAVQLIFTDAAGVQWWRDSHGNLELWKRPRQ
jgi:hypothetical protein